MDRDDYDNIREREETEAKSMEEMESPIGLIL